MKRRVSLVILAGLVALALRCGGEDIIARGGDFVLSVDDLRYEISRLGPSAAYDGTYEDRLGVVDMLAARHYLAVEARAKGYGDEVYETTVTEARKKAAAEAYHGWKVERLIQTPRIQRLPWLAKLDRKIHLMDMRFMVYEVAEEALAEIRAGRSFESLAAEVEGREDISVNDMGWRIWKELTLEVANVVFRLDVKETSPIVKGRDGYHLFYLANAEKLGLSFEIQSLRSKKFLAEMKKERLLENERTGLVRRYDVTFRDDGIAAALKTFASAFQGERPADDLMGEVVCAYPEGRVLVGDLFSAYYSVPNESRPYVGDYHGIREMAIDLMMPDLEADAALEMGLGRSRDVMWAGKKAGEDYLVFLMEDYFRSGIVVTDEDLEEYYKEHLENLKNPPRYKVSRILSSTSEEAQRALRRLELGGDFLEIAAEISEKDPKAETSGELDWIYVGTVSAFDSALAGLEPGEITGVFESSSGFEILRLDGWEDAFYPSYEEVVPRMKTYITSTRANEMLAEWVERKKLEVGYYVDEALLRKSEFPFPDFKAKRREYEERQESSKEPVLPKIGQ